MSTPYTDPPLTEAGRKYRAELRAKITTKPTVHRPCPSCGAQARYDNGATYCPCGAVRVRRRMM